MQRPEFRRLIADIIKYRQPLPPPAGVVKGSASDPKSIHEISEVEAQKLAEQDNLQALEQKENLPSS